MSEQLSALEVHNRRTLRDVLPANRLDRVVAIVVVLLMTGMILTIATGDRIGLTVINTQADSILSVNTALRLNFSEEINDESAQQAFQVTPVTDGELTVSGRTLTFTPRVGWQASTRYSVSLSLALMGATGRRLTQPYQTTFAVRAPSVLVMIPATRAAESTPPNIFRVDPTRPMQPEQLTHERGGVVNYAPAPDGSAVAYAAWTASGTIDLFLLDMTTRETRRLTACIAAYCQTPAWSPDGTKIAYERVETNQEIAQLDEGAPRTWILNIRDLSAAPLFSESGSLGGTPRWSHDGTKLAVFDRDLGAIVILDLPTGSRELIRTVEGVAGDYAFAPDSQSLTFPQLFNVQRAFYTELAIADFAARTITPLTSDDTPVSDYSPTWNAADNSLVIARRYLDGRDGTAAQVYQIMPNTNGTPTSVASITALIVDPNYYHAALSFDPVGARLVMMRRSERDATPVPGVWVYDLKLKTLWQVADDAYLPAWLP